MNDFFDDPGRSQRAISYEPAVVWAAGPVPYVDKITVSGVRQVVWAGARPFRGPLRVRRALWAGERAAHRLAKADSRPRRAFPVT